MSKAVMIIDMPSRCGMCEMSGTSVCLKWSRKEAHTFPKDCPLRELPPKQDISKAINEWDRAYITGYNDCLSQICGGKTDE